MVEFKSYRSASVAVINRSKTKILLFKYDDTYPVIKHRGHYNLIGGNVEGNELSFTCLKRELDEEILDKELVKKILLSIVYFGTFSVCVDGGTRIESAIETMFLSALDNEYFETLVGKTNYTTEGIPEVVNISSELLKISAWSTPYLLQELFCFKAESNPYSMSRIMELMPDYNKILSENQMITISMFPQKTAYTAGCFDLTHLGHFEYLKKIKSDHPDKILVVGIGSDKVVSKIKGNGRPALSQDIRAAMVSESPFVDFVVMNDEEIIDGEVDYINVFNYLRPNYMCVPSDCKNDTPNIEFCNRLGIEIIRTEKSTINVSTTQIINSIA